MRAQPFLVITTLTFWHRSIRASRSKTEDQTQQLVDSVICEDVVNWYRQCPLARDFPKHNAIVIHAGIWPQFDETLCFQKSSWFINDCHGDTGSSLLNQCTAIRLRTSVIRKQMTKRHAFFNKCLHTILLLIPARWHLISIAKMHPNLHQPIYVHGWMHLGE